jgi:hypothetical protein
MLNLDGTMGQAWVQLDIVKWFLMNKYLLRQLKPFLLTVTPQDASHLIEVFDSIAAAVGKNWERLYEKLRVFFKCLRRALRKQGVPKIEISRQISDIGEIAIAWLAKWAVLWETFISPEFCCFQFLETTLDSNRIPEWRDFTFEEIKKSLLDRHWPPQRQRCDFVPAPAI